MSYKGFTLVEMLIVMGILIILMAVGITAGRFAIDRANRVQHQNAANNLYTALLKYKLDNGEYPRLGGCSSCIVSEFFSEALGYSGTNPVIKNYMEKGTFDGGTDATFYYHVDPYNAQFVIVCVSLGGIDDEFNKGHYCTGDGIGTEPVGNPLKDIDIGTVGDDLANVNIIRGFDASDWYLDRGFVVQ